MKILVTGHRGFIGQNFVRSLLDDGHDVETYEWNEPYLEEKFKNTKLCIHLGAISSTTYSNVPQLLEQNYYFTRKLYSLCRIYGTNLQFASSASLYGVDNKTFRVVDKPAPTNNYAWSKFLCEEFLNSNTHYPINVQIFRYFNVYGPHEEHKGDQASPYQKFKQQAIDSGVIKIFEGSESYLRDFIHVEELINIQKQFFDVKMSGTWNIGTGKPKSFLAVAREIAEMYNATIKEIPMPEKLKASYQKHTCADMSNTNLTLSSYSRKSF